MNDKPPDQFTNNVQTRYTIQFKGDTFNWLYKTPAGNKVAYFNTREETREVIKNAFNNKEAKEAITYEWKKSIVTVDKAPITNTVTYYDVQSYPAYDKKTEPYWYVRRGCCETLKEAEEFIRVHQVLLPDSVGYEKFRIVKRVETTTSTILE